MKKFIYLISPNQVTKNFYKKLDSVLSSNKIKFFQLRLKKYSFEEILEIGKKVKVITDKYNVKLIINDSPHLAKKINDDGCHLGQSDMSIEKAYKYTSQVMTKNMGFNDAKEGIEAFIEKRSPNWKN